MESFRKAAEVTGRVIPENSVAQDGAGGTVYLYAKSGVTSKGKPWTQFYAKAFRPAQRRHEWHKVFATMDDRLAAVQAFLKGEKVS